MKLSYYPGCSLTGTAAEYDHSIREAARLLNIELVELEDWSCCGASSGHMTNVNLGIELAARNLELAQGLGLDLLTPCSACFQRLRAADVALRANSQEEEHEPYRPDFSVVHMSRFLSQPEMLKSIEDLVLRPLRGLEIACYYGCLSVRPPAVTGAPDYEDPQGLDSIVRALGATNVRWSHKTECCSGSLSMTRPDIARALVGNIIEAARRGGAGAVVTDCPMCQANLDSRQIDENESGRPRLPVFFVTELMTLALSTKERPRRWKAHLVDPGPLLRELDLQASPSE